VLAALMAGAARADDTGGIVGSVKANPLSVEVTLPTDPIKRGRWFRITAQVSNAGSTPLDNVAVTLVHPAGLQLDRIETQTIARVPAQGSKSAKWEACSDAAASYVVLARAEVGAYVAESPAKVAQIILSRTGC
jgi:uncharacterized membrane protein